MCIRDRINTEGKKEVLTISVGDNESAKYWLSFRINPKNYISCKLSNHTIVPYRIKMCIRDSFYDSWNHGQLYAERSWKQRRETSCMDWCLSLIHI